MEGWIKIHRGIQSHWIWNDPSYLKAWISIIMTVNYENKRVLIGGELIECDRGQSVLSLEGWVKTFGKKWTIQRVRTFFDLLTRDQMVTTEGLRKTTRLTVCNYNDYQDLQQGDNTEKTSTQQTSNRQVTTTKEREEREEGKEIKNIINYDFVSPEFKEPFEMWMKYKKEKKQMYKSSETAKVAYETMVSLSGNDPQKAVLIVKKSMVGNYAGLFELKQTVAHPATSFKTEKQHDSRF